MQNQEGILREGIFDYKLVGPNYILQLAASPLASRGFDPRGDQNIFLAKFIKGPRKFSAKKNDSFVLHIEKSHKT